MRRVLFLLLVVLLAAGLISCPGPYNEGGEGTDTGNPIERVDPVFWFDDIYEDLLDRQEEGTMGQVANCEYVCEAIRKATYYSPLVPASGTALYPANCEYLLKMIDKYNEWLSGVSSNYGSSEFATQQLVDTTAADMAIEYLYGSDRHPGQLIAGTDRGIVYAVLGGGSWAASPFTESIRSVGYGGGMWVASSLYGGKFYHSPDKVTWTESNVPTNTGWYYKIVYGNGRFVAVNNLNQVAVSVDGINWSLYPLPFSGGSVTSIAYGKGRFVVVKTGTYSDGEVAYSTDGINWTLGYIPVGAWSKIVYGKDRFVAVGAASSSAGKTAYSLDGITFYPGASSTNYGSWISLIYGRGCFLAGCGTGTYYSTDGVNWTEIYDMNGNSVTVAPVMCYGQSYFALYPGLYYYELGAVDVYWQRFPYLDNELMNRTWYDAVSNFEVRG